MEATKPDENSFEYPCLIKAGNDIKPIVTTVAPTMPVLAARSAPTTIIEILRPYGVPLKIAAMSCSIFAAIPERSKITPIRTNKGTASKV